ncbi:SVP1-like protein 2 [Lentinula lateritia]|uniref:SVP1-like protein 2 n=1 Tax=Lentinula aff. lateritia TaxID=2804960 RepID=A0ACC1U1P2_9AGAR|nr:SVP1-like protein 2 [Lentinula aff. lateritia]KAJ3855644.1 SVP1-like protein 2 [Lentinula lateritia]
MNLARHSITATNPVHIFDTRLDADCEIFTTCSPAGFAVYKAWPLQLLRKRELSGGTLAAAMPMHTSSLLFLLGGGRSPLYPLNKVILWDDAIGSEVAELEFRERVRGFACRRGWLAVSLRRRVIVFEIGRQVTRYQEWDTCDNPKGLVALASGTHATLLAIPGRQMGHVQLIHLPPCSPPPLKGPPPSTPPKKPPPPPEKYPVSIIAAHTTALSTLSVPPSGRLLATTSSRGTLVRIWDSLTGKLVRELRRGADKAEIFGVAFRPDEQELCVWSDKGTVHLFTLLSAVSNRQSTFSPLAPYIPLPKYFESEWSYAQYRIPTQSSHISLSATTSSRSTTEDIPDEERCVVGWIGVPSESASAPSEYQLIALTYTGGWYRLSIPNTSSTISAPFSSSSPPRDLHGRSPSVSSTRSERGYSKGKEKAKGSHSKASQCQLQEFRRYGRWDGWD